MCTLKKTNDLSRYHRQIIFDGLGEEGQRRLSGSSVLLVGVGGLGSWTSELLVRAGIGQLRMIDDDTVTLTNLHRQAMYDESAAEAGLPKVQAAAEYLRNVNRQVILDPIVTRIHADNADSLLGGIDLILDGTDNFATRYLLNDLSVRYGLPWVMAGVTGSEAQIMTIVPGETPCLRCVFPDPPEDPLVREFPIIGPIVSAVAAMQVCEVIKILAGRKDKINRHLLKFDLWTSMLQQVNLGGPDPDCSCSVRA